MSSYIVGINNGETAANFPKTVCASLEAAELQYAEYLANALANEYVYISEIQLNAPPRIIKSDYGPNEV